MKLATLISAPLVALALTATDARAQRAAPLPYDLIALHADVRHAVEVARDYEQRALAVAENARATAQAAESAASRARDGEEGYRAYDYADDPQLRHYEGSVEGGRPNGLGVLTFGGESFVGDRYAGAFTRSHKDGLGVYTYGPQAGTAADSRYEGEYSMGRAEGFGVFQSRGGARYRGSFRNTALDGYGVYYCLNGTRYEGGIARQQQNGFGVLWSEDGRVRRSGVWTNGRFTRRLAPPRR